MKQNIFTILFSFVLVGMLSAQTHKINYSFSIENCTNLEMTNLFSGTMNEGDSFLMESVSFPSGESQMQFFYNLLVGSKLGVPKSSLTEDINLNITLMGVCDLDVNNLPTEEELLDLLSFKFEVTGVTSGKHSTDDYYYFENGKEFYLKILITKLVPFLNYLQYSLNDFTPFFIQEDDKPDFNGIRKENDGQYYSIYASHFSTIGIGIRKNISAVQSENLISAEYSLAQNYPNPFNPTTKISYNLLKAGLTKLTIYNAIGEEIYSLLNETQQVGFHSIDFSASELPSGMYFYTLTSGNFTQTRKMILLK